MAKNFFVACVVQINESEQFVPESRSMVIEPIISKLILLLDAIGWLPILELRIVGMWHHEIGR
jgi:hypothetical protein